MRTWLMVSLLAANALACAQSDVGLVNQVSGEVAYTPGSGAPLLRLLPPAAALTRRS